MCTVYHTSLCLPRVSPIIFELDSQATPLHSLCVAQDQTPLVRHVRRTRAPAEAKGAFSDCSGILGSSSVHLRLHACVQGHLRRHLLQQVLVHRRAGNVPTTRDQPDGERDVPVPRVGAQRRSRHVTGVRRDDPQGFRRSRALSYVYPPVDQEDDALTHCQSLRSAVKYKSVAVVWAAISIATQICIPPSPKSCRLHYSPHYPRHTLFFVLSLDVPSVVSLPTHPSRRRGLYCQDRIGVVVARSPKGRSHSGRSLQNQDVRIRFAGCVVIQFYCSSRYSPRPVVLKTMPIVYSPPTQLQLVQVAYHIFKDIYIPSLDDALGWATWRAVGDGLRLLHLASLGSSLHFHVVSIVAAYNFFRRHMYITENNFC